MIDEIFLKNNFSLSILPQNLTIGYVIFPRKSGHKVARGYGTSCVIKNEFFAF